MADSDEEGRSLVDRRRFLKVATCTLGGGVGVVMAAPVVRFLVDPAGETTVTAPTEPIDVGNLDGFVVGDDPKRVDLVAPVIKDAWIAAKNVVLGAAWIRRVGPDKLEAWSAVCPHLGCAIGWDPAQKNYLCPCHNSRFAPGGDMLTGPSKRGLDPLPIAVKDGRLQLTWVRFKNGGATREPA
jgi:menaquinol-cytochrome c reductase iron-sulfur subunit